MKEILLPLVLTLTVFKLSYAQTESIAAKPWKSPYKTKYTRLGINTIGEGLNPALTPAENMTKGNIGAQIGAVLETGRVFYFLKRSQKRIVNVGLDWTIVSLSYNPAKKSWKHYSEQVGQPDAQAIGWIPMKTKAVAPFIGSAASRLGPVVAVNPVEKLVIELRGQVSASAYTYLMGYNEDVRSFATFDNREEGKVKYVLFDIRPSFGITIRRGRLGLAFDYTPGKVNMNYTEIDSNGNEFYHSMQVPFNTIQLKLSF